jgi:uncharacterized protein YndB with AHSA1/START domain
MFDLTEELAALERTVDRAGDAVAVAITRTYPARPDDIWSALTDPEQLPRWFYPVSGDLRPGGTFQLEGNMGGEIRRCEPPHHLEVTFGMPDSVVRVRLRGSDDATTLELTHTVPLALAGSGAGAVYVGPGWDAALLVLGLHLRGIEVGDPLEIARTAEMVEFSRGAIDAWAQAAVGSGTATPQEVAAARQAVAQQYAPGT